MSLQITIGGVDYTSFVDFHSVKVDNNISVTSDTSSFNIKIASKEIARPKGGSELIVLNGTNNREFAGVLMNPTEDELASGVMLYQCKSRDYGFWADKKLVIEDFTPDYAGNMIKTAVSTFCPGFTTNNVQTGPLAPYQKIDYMPPTKFVKRLADLFSYGWYIDYYKDFHFFSFETLVSPLPNNQLNVDLTSSAPYFSDLKLGEDVSQVRTRAYMKGHRVGVQYTVTDTFVGDAQQNSFPLKYEPIHDLSKMTVTVGGTAYARKKDIVEGLPTANTQDSTAYINFDSPQSRFNAAPGNGLIINVTYYPRLREVLAVSDVQSQKIMAARDGQDGIYEHVIDDPGLSWDDQTIAQSRGQLEINKYGRPHYSGSFKSFLQGWRAGQFFYFYSKTRMDGDLNGYKMFVTKVTKTLVNHPLNGVPTFQYTVSISDTPYVF